MAHSLAALELPGDRLLTVWLRASLSGVVPVEERASDTVRHLLETSELGPQRLDHPHRLVGMK
eukprot:12929636-Alexandrium_andersonii.AAC.1